METPFSLIWIVGASTGIGRATALAYAKCGIRVVASARSTAHLESLVGEGGGRIIAIPLDVTDAAAVHRAALDIAVNAGQLDALLFAAATWTNSVESQARADAVRPVFDVNVMGALHCLDAVLPGMKQRGKGYIGLISSVAGFRGLPRGLAYGASKAALTHIAESLRFECRRFGVAVQVIHPGFVKTPLTDKNDFPMPFLMSAPAAAARIVRQLGGPGFEITFPRRFTWMLKLLRLLPYRLYFALVARATMGLPTAWPTGTRSATDAPDAPSNPKESPKIGKNG